VVGPVEEVLEEQQMEGRQSLLKVAAVDLKRVVPEEAWNGRLGTGGLRSVLVCEPGLIPPWPWEFELLL
jgi:hypothetical protein